MGEWVDGWMGGWDAPRFHRFAQSPIANRPIAQSPNRPIAQSRNRLVAQSPSRSIAQSPNRIIASRVRVAAGTVLALSTPDKGGAMASSGTVGRRPHREFRPEIARKVRPLPPNSLVFEVPEETKIRPDGVGAPTPEDLLVSETTGPYELVSSAVSVAIRSLESLQLAMLETARAFDAGDVAQGNRRLVSLATGLRLLTTLADVAARAARLNLTELS